MIPKAPEDQENPWETPSLEPDLELIETSHRLVALSDETFLAPPDLEEDQKVSTELNAKSRIVELEAKNQYLFNRNVALVAKLAEIEVLNRRLSEEVIALKKSARTPWFMRWLRRPE
jgi:molecular chaperone GrpE (heat shock protein)